MNQSSQQTRGSIWKYEVENNHVLELPAGARVLSVGWDKLRLIPMLYVLVDPEVPKVKRRVKVLTTGHEITGDNWEFAGSAMAPLAVAYHVFLEIV